MIDNGLRRGPLWRGYRIQFVRDLLRQKIKEIGSQRAFAKRHGLSVSYVNDVLKGRREPNSPRWQRALRLKRHVIYERIFP